MSGERRTANGDPDRRVRSDEDLDAWALAMDLAEAAYRSAESFPAEEAFGLRSQMRRAAVSVPSNIAGGRGRRAQKGYARFLRTARGSRLELRTQVEFARRVSLLPEPGAQRLRDADRVGRVVYGLASSLHS